MVPALARCVVATLHATCILVVTGVVLYAALDDHRTFLGPAWSARAPSTGGWDASFLGAAQDHRNPSTEEAGAACEPHCCAETWPVDMADAKASALLRCANTTASPELPFSTGVVVVTMITTDVRALARAVRKEVSHLCIQDRARHRPMVALSCGGAHAVCCRGCAGATAGRSLSTCPRLDGADSGGVEAGWRSGGLVGAVLRSRERRVVTAYGLRVLGGGRASPVDLPAGHGCGRALRKSASPVGNHPGALPSGKPTSPSGLATHRIGSRQLKPMACTGAGGAGGTTSRGGGSGTLAGRGRSGGQPGPRHSRACGAHWPRSGPARLYTLPSRLRSFHGSLPADCGAFSFLTRFPGPQATGLYRVTTRPADAVNGPGARELEPEPTCGPRHYHMPRSQLRDQQRHQFWCALESLRVCKHRHCAVPYPGARPKTSTSRQPPQTSLVHRWRTQAGAGRTLGTASIMEGRNSWMAPGGCGYPATVFTVPSGLWRHAPCKRGMGFGVIG